MSTAGTLSVDIVGNISGLNSALKQADSAVTAFGHKAEALGKKFTDAGKKLTMGLTAPILALGTAAIYSWDKQAQAMAQVEQGLKSTGNAAGFTADELFEMASGLQRISRYGDEDILKGVTAQLLTFTNIANDQFARTQQAVLDLSARLGTDLQSAAIQVGKALNDPVANLSALSRSGIQFSEDQKKVIKSLTETGKLAEAQTLILDELNKQYGGSAEAALAGAGSIIQLKNSIGDVTEEFGRLIMDALDPIVDKIKDWVEVFKDLDDQKKKTILVVGLLAASLGPLLITVGLLITAVGKLTLALHSLGTALTWLASHPVVAIAAALSALLITWASLQEGLETGWEYVVEFFVDAANSILLIMNGIVDGVELAVNSVIKLLNLIPGVKIPLADLGGFPYFESLERHIEDAEGATDTFIRKLKSIDDVRYAAVISELEAVKRSVEDLPTDEAVREFDRLATEIVAKYSSIYPELERLSEKFMSNITASSVDSLTKVEGAARIASDDLSEGLEDILTSFRHIGIMTSSSLDELRKSFNEAYLAVEDTKKGTIEWADAVQALLPEIDRLEKYQKIFVDYGGEVNAEIAAMIEKAKTLIPLIEHGSPALYTWGNALHDFFDGVKTEIETSGKKALAFLENTEAAISDALSSTMIEILGYGEKREQEEEDHQERIKKIKEEYADESEKDLKAALDEEDRRYEESKTTILGIVESGVDDLITTVRDNAIKLAADWLVNQFVAMAAGIETAMTGANTAAGIGVSNLLTTLAPLIAALGAIAVVLDILSGEANIAGAIGHWLDSIFFPDAMKKDTVYKNGIPQYGSGGIVAGALGEPRLIVAHGGEPIGAAGFAEAMDYTRFAEAVAAGVYDAMEDVLPGKDRPIVIEMDGVRLGRALFPAIQSEEQRLGLVTE
jgi:hypothetical protein